MCFQCDDVIAPMFETTPYEADKDDLREPAGANIKNKNPKLLIPRPYHMLSNIRKISTCIHRNAAIDNKDILWIWGADSMAQRDGVYSNDLPQNIEKTPQQCMENVLDVCCGAWHILCITKDKKLWGWGENDLGQLGLGDTKTRRSPTLIMEDVESVFANEYQSFAVRGDHTLWGWGYNSSKILLEDSECCYRPKLLMDNVKKMSCNSDIAAILRQDGTMWVWGMNVSHIIFTKPLYRFYQPLLFMDGVVDLSFPASDCCNYGLVITENKDLYCLGGLTFQSQRTAKLRKEQGYMPLKLMRNISAAYAGNDFIHVIDIYGRLFALERNELGQCGTGKSTGVLKKPTLIMTHTDQAAPGYAHGMGLQTNGNLWIWGGDYGMLELE